MIFSFHSQSPRGDSGPTSSMAEEVSSPPPVSFTDASTPQPGSVTDEQFEQMMSEDVFENRPSWQLQVGYDSLSSSEMSSLEGQILLSRLAQEQWNLQYIDTTPPANQGVIVRNSDSNEFVCRPSSLKDENQPLWQVVQQLNFKCCWTVNTSIVKVLVGQEDVEYIKLPDERKMKIYSNVASLIAVDRYMEAALVREPAMAVVWGETADSCINRAKEIQEQLLQPYVDRLNTRIQRMEEKPNLAKAKKKKKAPMDANKDEDDGWQEESSEERPRRTVLVQSVQVGVTLMVLIICLAGGWRNVAIDITTDGRWIRMLFLVVLLLQLWLALFFFQSVVGSLTQIFGPISHVKGNSRFYSGRRPRLNPSTRLAHVTVQCPVYKEDLNLTIKPTIESIKAAIARYQSRGGSANIFVNDDGMNLISPEAAKARRQFYKDNEIGWVARPKHVDPNVKGPRKPWYKGGWLGLRESKPESPAGVENFTRAGKFKKASNMNFALAFTVKVEEKLGQNERRDQWTVEEERREYARCCKEVYEELPQSTQYDGNIRMGDYILLVDSDTRVPNDCLIYAVTELEQAPDLAILQFTSGVQNVTTSFFESGITFFTYLIYSAIGYGVSSGDVAPFVGHNAFLRWSAIQQVAYRDPDDPTPRYWSESTVSEDFDMALRLQIATYIVRFATYSCHPNPQQEKIDLKEDPLLQKDEFKEGVSLTVYDELSRWEKYAYGCSELIFHPLRYWPSRGPLTSLFRKFIKSNMPLPSKISIMAYVGTYYAIACAWALTLFNYFIVGWYNGYLDRYYVDSFKLYFPIVLVFSGLGNVALAILRIRCGEQDFFTAFYTCLKWVPLLSIYLGGISLHISWAIASHLLHVNIEWGATMKEQEDIPFQDEIKKIISRFRKMMIFMLTLAAIMIYLAKFAPPLWRIVEFTPIYPLAVVIISHFSLPIVLNPGLIKFKW